MKTYTIIAGVNGCGKSSLTGVLKNQLTDLGKMIDVDALTASHGGNNVLAGRLAVDAIRSYLKKGICFTQETTLSGHLTAQTAQKARAQGYFIRMYYIGLSSAEDSIARIANRVRRGGHHIPSEDVLRRFSSRVQSVSRVLPFCDAAYFFTNDNGFQQVGEYRNGEIICYPDAPDWLRQFADALSV